VVLPDPVVPMTIEWAGLANVISRVPSFRAAMIGDPTTLLSFSSPNGTVSNAFRISSSPMKRDCSRFAPKWRSLGFPFMMFLELMSQ
jgi:hypothetical protein